MAFNRRLDSFLALALLLGMKKFHLRKWQCEHETNCFITCVFCVHCCYCQWSSQIHSCSCHSTCSLLCIRFCHLYRVYHVWLFRCFRAFIFMPSYKSSANWNNCGFLPHRLHSNGFLYILHLRLQHTWWSCLVVSGITDKMDNAALYVSLEQDFGKIICISSLHTEFQIDPHVEFHIAFAGMAWYLNLNHNTLDASWGWRHELPFCPEALFIYLLINNRESRR